MKQFKISKLKQLFAVLIVTLLTLTSCYNPSFNKKGWTQADKALGTFVQITIFTPPTLSDKTTEEILDELISDIQTYGTLFGKYSPEGEIYKVNHTPAGKSVLLSPLTAELIEKSLNYAEQTNGLFNPAINPVVSLWSQYKKENTIPPQQEIERTIKLTDYKKVNLTTTNTTTGPTITLETQGMGLDLGGVAKGYIADLLFAKLEQYGISSAIINLGGNIHIKGMKQWGRKFSVGIQDPNEDIGNFIGVVKIYNQAVVTSGDYQRFVIIDGKKYHHIIDPRTGYPGESDLRSVTIISNSGSEADALATGVFLMGLERGSEFIKNNKHLEAIFITNQNKVFISSGLKKNFHLTNLDYELLP